MGFTLKGHAIGRTPYMIGELEMIAITEVPGSAAPFDRRRDRGSITGVAARNRHIEPDEDNVVEELFRSQ